MKIEKLSALFHVVHSYDKSLQTFRISFFFGALLQKGICDRTLFFQNAEYLP
jgi:hypothetical protein